MKIFKRKTEEMYPTKSWKRTDAGNYIKYDPERKFYISFNEDPTKFNVSKTTKSKELKERPFPETAICVDADKGFMKSKFYILTGDFREEYDKLLSKGLKACMEFYESKKKDFGNPWDMGGRE